MQRDRQSLVLQLYAFKACGECRDLAMHAVLLRLRHAKAAESSAGVAQFQSVQPMAAQRGRSNIRSRSSSSRPLTSARAPLVAVCSACSKASKAGLARLVDKVEQGAVDIEKQRPAGVGNGERRSRQNRA